jgi:tetratricopeptide (TPR) repeat protein/SAM-dependent methyltransferase
MELTLDEALQKAIEAHKAGQIQEADRLYTAMLQAQPKHPDANHNMGVLAVGVGKVQEALPFFKTALEANPSIGQYWLSYIDALIKLDRMVDAQTVLDQAKGMGAKGEAFDQLEQRLNVPNGVSIDPAQDQLDTLISLYQQGQLQQTLDSAKQLLSQFPNSLTLYNIQGAANARLGQLDAAIDSYKQALKTKPDYADAYYNIGNALKDKGDREAAIGSYKQATRIKPDYAEAYNNMGIALKDKGDLEAAIDSYKQTLKIKPDYADAYYNMGNALQDKGDLDDAIDSYNKALKIKPNCAEAYNNIGNAQRDKGDLAAAIDSYKQALKIKPNYAEAFNNIGAALHKGDAETAIENYKQALKINPYFAEAYSNMANALKDKGDLEAAIDCYKNAIKIKPDYPGAYNNMGIAMKDKGDLKGAIDSYKQALKINPYFAEAYSNMGNALKDKGDLKGAIDSYQQALKIKPDYAEAYNNFGAALKGVVFNKPNPGLMKIIVSLLDQKTSCRPRDIDQAAISLLKLEPILKELLEKNSLGNLSQSLQETILTLAKLPLLLKLMSVCPIGDLELERVLVNIRLDLLSSLDETLISPTILRFQSALALQCFTNEYIYTQTNKETELLDVLKNVVEKTLSYGQQPSPHSILCLASYKALHEYEWCDALTVNTDIEEVFVRQVQEPKEESRLKANIPILQEITDKVSSKVRDQYEENPYPRWVNLELPFHSKTIPKLVKIMKLKLAVNLGYDIAAPDILLAGCGTGQHSIGTALTFKNSKVLAVDLSLSSLAYAKRKTEELGLQNIDYMQADILNLGKLDKKFDIIECSGVLHHMDEPMAGWGVLKNCLKSGGLMRVGLYSELGRRDIVRMREEINQSGFGSGVDAMRSFRSDVINSDKEHHKRTRTSVDFNSLSTLRDLLFHVQEHRFTIPQIQDCLSKLGLQFCGFETEEIVRGFKLTNSGTDDLYDLDKWISYEKANPYLFANMYQFWCQKVT